MKLKHLLLIWMSAVVMFSCTTTTKVKSGEEAFTLKRYATAIPMLESEYAKAKDMQAKATISKMLAQSYDMQSDFQKALAWYAVYRENSVDQQAPLVYAQALMRVEQYAQAQKVLEQYIQVHRQDRRLVEPLIETCKEVIEKGEELKSYTQITPFGGNSSNADFVPFVFQDRVIFSSTRAESGKEATEWNQQAFASLWQSDFSGQNVEPFTFLENNYHQASLSLTQDGRTAYFVQCGSSSLTGEDLCQIYRTHKELDSWSDAELISLFGDTVNVGTPYITPNGSTLYFSAEAPYGYGGKDLYMLKVFPDGNYGEPLNLGSRVNSVGDEMYPYVTDDEQTLYYSSNHQTYGGLDIFKATKVGRLFTSAERLPYGLNSGGDDFALKLFPAQESIDSNIAFTGILSSNRGGRSDNLYVVELQKMPPPEELPILYILEGTVVENIYADSLNPNSAIIGQKAISTPHITLSGQNIPSDADGYFTAQLDSGFAYRLHVQKTGYLGAESQFHTTHVKAEAGDTVFFKQKIVLSKIIQNVEIVLDNIYYDFDKWDIREDAMPTLDSLANILHQNPHIYIELASHTDCRGNAAYNLNLSQKRAESVVEYLISKNIDSQRLTAKGYGDTSPVEHCICEDCTEEQHQRNRRTTFKIIEIK